ncbi:EamA family transporter [Alphaproteobacteria bacterium GH1-50]|uniref:EamA family transporter n=1 Tax=Kangsaoukella pontilimi TaxID=2691042 RepID=A0A7C9IS77_9RHOB|nr:DMT family transporter [Kangsaoukella pontilimi]MXQ08366.1 EamA family transporter [Kangsaoukella pontilimi]
MSFAPVDPFRAIALKVISVLLFVVMASFIKAASAEVPPGETVFFRSFFALPVIIGWLAWQGQLGTGLKTENPLGHLWRGLIGTMAMGMSFAGLAILPLYEVKAIQYAMPLFVVILAAMFLGETIRKVRLTAVGMGMVGVLIILWPRLSAFGSDAPFDPMLAFGTMIVLTGSFCAALAQVFVRRLVETENTAAIVFYFSITATLLSLITLPFGWKVPSGETLLYLLGAGLVGGTGQILLTSSYRYADASIIAPFEYSSMLFAVTIGFVWFDEVPTAMMMLGAAIVIAAGVLIILRERYLKIQRGKARNVVTKYG